jgi:hypothetical protein
MRARTYSALTRRLQGAYVHDSDSDSRTHVTHVMRELNQRPRKTLDYDTPQNRFKAERDTPEHALR